MTAEQERLAFVRLLDRFEKPLQRSVLRELNRFTRDAARQFAEGERVNFIDLAPQHEIVIEGFLTRSFRQVIPSFGKLALANIKSVHIPLEFKISMFEAFIEAWIVNQSLAESLLITSTSIDNIRKAILQGQLEGDGPRKIARRIASIAGINRVRAEMIAITEVHNAATFGSISSVRDVTANFSVKLLKQWLPTLDERTRISHAAMSSHPPIPLNEKFRVGGALMDRPGDPDGPASQVIRCRCGLTYVEPTTNLLT